MLLWSRRTEEPRVSAEPRLIVGVGQRWRDISTSETMVSKTLGFETKRPEFKT